VNDDALLADFVVMSEDDSLTLTDDPRLWGAILWRLGPRAYRLHILGPTTLSASEALQWGLVDALEPLTERNAVAFETAAELIRSRGGDALERAAFAWLFATGEPQEGLRAFLGKRVPSVGAGS